MANDSVSHVLGAWQNYERSYNMIRSEVTAFSSQAALIGGNMILDVPTRIEYMGMIRAEADEMLAYARRNRSAVRLVFDRISARRDELRLLAQNDANAPTRVLSRLMAKNRSKYDLLVRAADTLAQEGRLPAVGSGKAARSAA